LSDAVAGLRRPRPHDSAAIHFVVGVAVCLFVLSPALFTPWGFGFDYTNHLWLVWQQGLAIANTGHPTLYLQSSDGIFEPFYGFYGGTLYATAGTFSALLGGHPYPVYVVSIGASAAVAYGGMWWLGRQLGLSRWSSHLPAFVVVTAAYYLTDAYARGAWPELVALSGVPMFIAGAMRLLTARWGAWSVALFVLGAVMMTGSHNIILFWSVLVIGPIAVAAWIAVGRSRPPLRRALMVAGLGAVAVGINAWFLALDVWHATNTQAWIRNSAFLKRFFTEYIYFDNLGNVLDPLRATPTQSTTYGLTIAAPVAAFAFSLALCALAWPKVRRAGRALSALWLILLVAMAVLVVLMVMPGSWWIALGPPLADIQFPYRLAGWLLVAIAMQLAISLRLAQDLAGRRRRLAVAFGLALVVLTVVQASAQMYSGPRLHGDLTWNFHPRRDAFANGPTTPPQTYYAERSYADASQPVVEVPRQRTISLPVPEPGQTRLAEQVRLPPGSGPLATNIAAGPYVVRIEGMKVVGRTAAGMMVVEPSRPRARTARLVVVADGGGAQTLAGILSILCLVACLGLVAVLTIRPRLRYRRGPLTGRR
jgi:hypothetical protein